MNERIAELWHTFIKEWPEARSFESFEAGYRLGADDNSVIEIEHPIEVAEIEGNTISFRLKAKK